MKTALICFSDAGAALSCRLCSLLGLEPSSVHSVRKFAEKYGFTPHEKISADMGELFSAHEALLFVGACGIAVRSIAPHLKSKTEDPAVLVLDDGGRFVIPILSGHIGGANELARSLADQLGAEAVITTATDGAERFSCDAWAKTHDCAISSMDAAKAVSAAILTRDVPITSEPEFPLPEDLPGGLPGGLTRGGTGEIGIYIGVRTHEPFETTLRLIPRAVTLGIGCRRGISADAVKAAIEKTLGENGIDLRSVTKIASVDLKKDEAGLCASARDLGAELVFYSAEELAAVPGSFTESEFVKKTVGVGNVCERAAVLGCGGKDASALLMKKTAENGVTVAAAIAIGDRRIVF